MTASPGRNRVSESRKRSTSTATFGVGKRESHDASDFYARFSAPVISNAADVQTQPVANRIWTMDAREMDEGSERIKDNSVALVVTSPPYFAGKAYEVALGEGHIPDSYITYLEMLRDVFAKCAQKLEPGGRIAVNVANLGRKPYRSLSADIVRILEDDLGLLLRGEIVWKKSEGASGNCAWGSFQSASNPVLRDLTERVIVASKGRFDRALPVDVRAAHDPPLPHRSTISKHDFMKWTTDVWDLPPESATRVGHPAPFPVELPMRLIELLTYEGDVVLDPFMGSGTTAVAAVQSSRRYLGFDTDPDYAEAARERIATVEAGIQERRAQATSTNSFDEWWHELGAEDHDDHDFQRRAVRQGKMAKEIAKQLLEQSGFEIVGENRKVGAGVEVNFVARDARGDEWYFDVSGALSKGNDRAGLRRTDTLWKALGKAAVLRSAGIEGFRLVLLTTDLPGKSSAGGKALAAAMSAADGAEPLVFDALEMLDPATVVHLQRLAVGT